MPFPALPGRQDRAIQLTRQLGVYPPGWSLCAPRRPAAYCAASRALALLLATHGYNNPVNSIDPTGHVACSGWDINGDCIQDTDFEFGEGDTSYTSTEDDTDTDNDGIPNLPDPSEPRVTLGTHSDPNCNIEEIVECFYNRGRLPSGTYIMTEEELNNLMLALFYDIYKRLWNPLDWYGRRIYDTPFWDGYEVDNSTVCIGGACYKGIEVNYLAQGMYSAKYEKYELGIALVKEWKSKNYSDTPSEGTMYWWNIGYNYYMDQTLPTSCGFCIAK
jgi:hypothetical protein